MMDNHKYNLMAQLVEEHKSLWRIQNQYTKDSGACAECKDFWEKLIKDKEMHIEELTDMVKNHLA